jgi:anti-sigma-K factor RskA
MLSTPAPQQPAPPPQIVRVPAEVVPPSYIVVLSELKTQKPVLMVSAMRKSDQMLVKRLDDSIVVPDKSLELWALPTGQPPKSLGLVAIEDKQMLKLSAVADQSLGAVPALAVSLEPKGGSPTGSPTGPVLYSGPCIMYW